MTEPRAPMRILQLCTNFLPGGIQRHVLDLAADLTMRGHEVTLAGDHGDWFAPGMLSLPMHRVAGKGGSLASRLLALPQAARTLRRIVKDRGIEIVHAHETAPALVSRLATLGLDVPVVMTFHGSAPEREAQVARIARRCATLTVSPSHDGLARLVARGLPREDGRVIGLGIAALPPVADEAVVGLRSQLLDGRRGPLFLSLSRIDRQKGIDVMVEVARRVAARDPQIVFAVAGKGPLRDAAQTWIEAAGVGQTMHLLGAVSTVPMHLRAADAFLLTSRWENLPISIVEAFRAGLPVIATNCGGVRELVDDSVGTLAPVEDAQALAEAVLALAGDPAARARKAAGALERSLDRRFDPAFVHAEFERLYRDTIARTDRAARRAAR